MFEQLSYLRVHQPLLGVFEQVPNFAQLERGGMLRSFLEQLQSAGYTPHHQVLEGGY